MKPQDERRVSPRHMCSDFVQIDWMSHNNRRSSHIGVLEDVSPEGLCVNLDVPAPVGRTVHLHTRGFEGEAEVRYCDWGELGYQVGLEFLDGCTWDPQKWQPKHLLEV